MQALTAQAIAVLMISLRIAPVLAFAPPFTLLQVPAPVRMLLAVFLAAWIADVEPAAAVRISTLPGLVAIAVTELLLGVAFALILQLAFAALLTAGRTIDIQAGLGLAGLVDPATRAQAPLVGTLFSYAAAIIFFTTRGPADLLAIWRTSVEQLPPGTMLGGDSVGIVIAYLSAIFVAAFGAAGLIILVLFLLDMAIAFMSRTLPQMNVLLLGFEVKTLALLCLLPISLALAASLFLRMIRHALDTMTLLS